MFKTWSFWKTFFTSYIAFVAGIWGFVEAYTYFENDSLKNMLGSYWWVVYYFVPLIIALFIAVLRNESESSTGETLDQRNRRVMLNHVENFWVKGVLEKSLHGVALLDLGIKENPSAISYPWAMKRESTGETLPEGKLMLEIFEEIGMGRSLLILGAPGSGKTTMLLELARQLIKRAREDETEPIPVVFNLASWNERQSLADWLAEQLNILYTVPKKVAPIWVNENRMMLLLDGLDEVKQVSREKCVESINIFRSEYGLTSLVVCSRLVEYKALNKQLALEGAITIQPLSTKQVLSYFDKFGEGLASIKRLTKEDDSLLELAKTPLMLNIMTMAYQNAKIGDLTTSNNIELHRKHIFNTYIERMFERSSRTTKYQFKKNQTLRYLSWLARKMIMNNQIPFHIERVQLTWLEGKSLQSLFYLCVILTTIIGIGLISGIFFEVVGLVLLLFEPNRGVASVDLLFFWPKFGLFVGLLNGIGYGITLIRAEITSISDYRNWAGNPMQWLLKGFQRKIITGLVSGAITGILSWIAGEVFFGVREGRIIWGILGGIIGALTSWLIPPVGDIKTAELLKWSWEKALRSIKNIVIIGLILGFVFGLLILAEASLSIFEPTTGFNLMISITAFLFAAMTGGLLFSLFFVPIAGLLSGLRSGEMEGKTLPDQGIRKSLTNAIWSFILAGLLSGLPGFLLFLYYGTSTSILVSLFFLIVFSPIASLRYGGITFIQHFVIRVFLFIKKYFPWRIVSFLNFATSLIFLQPVGGGYLFIHRTLMEHFAEMDLEKIESSD